MHEAWDTIRRCIAACDCIVNALPRVDVLMNRVILTF